VLLTPTRWRTSNTFKRSNSTFLEEQEEEEEEEEREKCAGFSSQEE
jgi:hypothetical protein